MAGVEASNPPPGPPTTTKALGLLVLLYGRVLIVSGWVDACGRRTFATPRLPKAKRRPRLIRGVPYRGVLVVSGVMGAPLAAANAPTHTIVGGEVYSSPGERLDRPRPRTAARPHAAKALLALLAPAGRRWGGEESSRGPGAFYLGGGRWPSARHAIQGVPVQPVAPKRTAEG